MFFGGSTNPNATLYSDKSPFSNGNDRKKRSHIKAELVRKELLSRGDLIRLYQPPIPKSQLPTTNPFYTKTIVVRPFVSPYTAAPVSTTAGTLTTTHHRRHITTTLSPTRVMGPYDDKTISPITADKDSIWSGSHAARMTIQSAQVNKRSSMKAVGSEGANPMSAAGSRQ